MYLKLICFVIAMISSLAMAAESPLAIQTIKNLEAGKQQTVIVFGTSLSGEAAWADETKKWFDGTYPGLVKFVNASGSDKDSEWAVETLKTVTSQKPDLIFIEFSFNDAKDSKVPLEKAKANLAKIVTAVRAENPSADVVLLIMNLPWDAPNGLKSASIRPLLVQYNDNYRSYAAEKKLSLIDYYPIWENFLQIDPDQYHLWVPDGTHPSPEASVAIAWPEMFAFLTQSQRAASQ